MGHFITAVLTKEGQTIEELLAPYQEAFFVNEDGEEEITDNSKWDYYEVVDKSEGMLYTKNGEQVQSCLVKDVDLNSQSESIYNEYLALCDIMEHLYKERNQTKEEYAREQSLFAPNAILTPDGKWEEKEPVLPSVELDKKWRDRVREIFESVDPELTVTLVDCHI